MFPSRDVNVVVVCVVSISAARERFLAGGVCGGSHRVLVFPKSPA